MLAATRESPHTTTETSVAKNKLKNKHSHLRDLREEASAGKGVGGWKDEKHVELPGVSADQGTQRKGLEPEGQARKQMLPG